MIFNSWVSTVIICLIVAAFWIAFERSKPSASRLVLVSELCALAIGVRSVFSFVPYFNPLLAVIFLSGVALGGVEGFLIGSLTALLSNFIFGQGPWTLYQMISWGFAGTAGGVLAGTGILKKCDWKTGDYVRGSLVSVFLIIFVTGPLADLSGFFMMGERNLALLKVILAGGFAMNVSLAASTVFALCVIARPFLFSVQRAVTKSRGFTQNR